MPRREPGAESLRGLTGAGSSKVGVEKAMRARDVSREPRRPRRGEPDRDADSGADADAVEPVAYSEGGSGSSGSSPVDS
jgi:hypothetical protein